MDRASASEYTNSPYYPLVEECHPNTPTGANTDKFDVEIGEIHNHLVEAQYYQNRRDFQRQSQQQFWNAEQLTILNTSSAALGMNNQFEIERKHNQDGFYDQRPPSISRDCNSKSGYSHSDVMEKSFTQNVQSVNNEQEKMLHMFNQESMKEVHAASNAIDNLGFNYSQDIKVILTDLSTRLQENQSQFTQSFLQLPQLIQYNEVLMKNEMINSLTDMLNKERALNETQRELEDMKIDGIHSKFQAFKIKIAEKHYNRKLKQCALNTLRDGMVSSWKLRTETAEHVSQTLGDKYMTAQDELHAEVENLKRKLLLEKAEYESSIQDGLMKGLRSLNKEALKVMKLKCSSSDILCDAEQQTLPNISYQSVTSTEQNADTAVTKSPVQLDQFSAIFDITVSDDIFMNAPASQSIASTSKTSPNTSKTALKNTSAQPPKGKLNFKRRTK